MSGLDRAVRGPAALFGHDEASRRRRADDAAWAIVMGAKRLPRARPSSPRPTSAFADVGQFESPNSETSELGVGEDSAARPLAAVAKLGEGATLSGKVATPSPSSTRLRRAEPVSLSSPTRGEEEASARVAPVDPAYDPTVSRAIAAVAALGAVEVAAATLIHIGRAWGW